MKAILFLSIFLNTAMAQDKAVENSRQFWSNGSTHYLFSYNADSRILISDTCLDESQSLDKSKCEAAKALKNKNLKVDAVHFRGGKNPGAVACTEALKKKIIILKDSKNNENSFCVFEDESMISAINLQNIIK